MVDIAQLRRQTLSHWAQLPTKTRCGLIGNVRHHVAAAADDLVALSMTDQRTHPAETLAGELIPLCDASRWLQRRAPRLLRPKRLGRRDRPTWLLGVQSEVQRVPFGVVLIIGTWNYPMLLPGIQALQALAAGNAVLWKPSPGCHDVSARLCQTFYDAGVPREQLQLLDEAVESATSAIDQGVDLIVLTGAHATGVKVLERAAKQTTPCIMELSGCDATVVLEGADLRRAAEAVAFGLCFNGGATCIGPRRILVAEACADAFRDHLRNQLDQREPSTQVHPAALPAVSQLAGQAVASGDQDLLRRFDLEQLQSHGAMPPTVFEVESETSPLLSADLFAPIAGIRTFESRNSLIQLINDCPYGLGLSIFGLADEAKQIANQACVGSVVINDIIAPTADPRLPFGGRKQSGFGVTRGAEGLLAMTTPRVISTRKRGMTYHLQPPQTAHEELLGGALQFEHGSHWNTRLSGLRRLIRGVRLFQSTKPSSGDAES